MSMCLFFVQVIVFNNLIIKKPLFSLQVRGVINILILVLAFNLEFVLVSQVSDSVLWFHAQKEPEPDGRKLN